MLCQQITASLYIGDIQAAAEINLKDAAFTHVLVRFARRWRSTPALTTPQNAVLESCVCPLHKSKVIRFCMYRVCVAERRQF
jgi:hypothetical protein